MTNADFDFKTMAGWQGYAAHIEKRWRADRQEVEAWRAIARGEVPEHTTPEQYAFMQEDRAASPAGAPQAEGPSE